MIYCLSPRIALSLGDFKWSDWVITDLKKRAGVKKVSQKQEGAEGKMLRWLRLRKGNVFLSNGTTTAIVKAKWEKLHVLLPLKQLCSGFDGSIKLFCRRANVLAIKMCGSCLRMIITITAFGPNRCLSTPPIILVLGF